MKFREFITSRGTRILGGRSAENNEELVKQVDDYEEVFHTDAVGSPFVNIKGKAKKGDVKDAAVFCAAFSKDWKKNKSDVVVHRFKGRDIFKKPTMKTGTFGVKKIKKMKIRKKELEEFLGRWQ